MSRVTVGHSLVIGRRMPGHRLLRPIASVAAIACSIERAGLRLKLHSRASGVVQRIAVECRGVTGQNPWRTRSGGQDDP
jgi:hypothetical protein